MKNTDRLIGIALAVLALEGCRGPQQHAQEPRLQPSRTELPSLRRPPMIDAPRKGDGATILVVDDEPEAREIAVAGLESLNYQVITAPDARSALRST